MLGTWINNQCGRAQQAVQSQCHPTECHQQMFEIRIDVSVNRLFGTHETSKKSSKLVQNQSWTTWVKQGTLPLWISNVTSKLVDSWMFHVGYFGRYVPQKCKNDRFLDMILNLETSVCCKIFASSVNVPRSKRTASGRMDMGMVWNLFRLEGLDWWPKPPKFFTWLLKNASWKTTN